MKRIALVPVLAAAMVAIMGSAAYASQYIAYEGPGFTGRTQFIDACGVSNIVYHGSYKWFGDGQSGRMYNQPNARGPMHFELASNRNAEQHTSVGWQSIFIVC
ncbi:MiAMP1 family antimicrobial peptide [Nonomuraea sp. 3-1Str]|uniref:MiAMP1 family antimicrobial peptide n=1 Tax=unclassified Nonomuraea TaxID=2593643 RepID=UPI00285FFC8C|nr:MiAMP1 family antimicrobial peptide [Nonomuraea sp. 3-1Str]MDR8408734.1 MiAMP1 family antimicrobial peptide [Nonomuraea sp. 3-1Str]